MLSKLHKRIILFLFICIPSRLLIAYLGKKFESGKKLNRIILSLITFIMGLGFLKIYFIGSEKADAQLEWAGVERIWWDNLRIAHGVCYIFFSVFNFLNYTNSWFFIIAEVSFGLLAWIRQIFLK
jgi:hypothetical protein